MCDECGGKGKIELQSCPAGELNQDVLDAIDVADSGHLPVSGGMGDQSRWFMELLSKVRSNSAQVEAETKLEIVKKIGPMGMIM